MSGRAHVAVSREMASKGAPRIAIFDQKEAAILAHLEVCGAPTMHPLSSAAPEPIGLLACAVAEPSSATVHGWVGSMA